MGLIHKLVYLAFVVADRSPVYLSVTDYNLEKAVQSLDDLWSRITFPELEKIIKGDYVDAISRAEQIAVVASLFAETASEIEFENVLTQTTTVAITNKTEHQPKKLQTRMSLSETLPANTLIFQNILPNIPSVLNPEFVLFIQAKMNAFSTWLFRNFTLMQENIKRQLQQDTQAESSLTLDELLHNMQHSPDALLAMLDAELALNRPINSTLPISTPLSFKIDVEAEEYDNRVSFNRLIENKLIDEAMITNSKITNMTKNEASADKLLSLENKPTAEVSELQTLTVETFGSNDIPTRDHKSQETESSQSDEDTTNHDQDWGLMKERIIPFEINSSFANSEIIAKHNNISTQAFGDSKTKAKIADETNKKLFLRGAESDTQIIPHPKQNSDTNESESPLNEKIRFATSLLKKRLLNYDVNNLMFEGARCFLNSIEDQRAQEILAHFAILSNTDLQYNNFCALFDVSDELKSGVLFTFRIAEILRAKSILLL